MEAVHDQCNISAPPNILSKIRQKAVQNKSSSKPINMGYSFVDLDETSTYVKMDRNLNTPFERYLFFRIQSHKRKEKKQSVPLHKIAIDFSQVSLVGMQMVLPRGVF